MGWISNKRWRSYFESSIFNITYHRHIAPRQME